MKKLVLKYMRVNRGRTCLTILGISVSVLVLSLVILMSSQYMQEMRIKTQKKEGSWHARLHQVTPEQRKRLSHMWGVEMAKQNPEIDCVEITLKHPGIFTVSQVQQMAKHIGMKELPEDEWGVGTGHETLKYDITWNDALLELYGVFSQGADGAGAVACTTILLVIVFSSIFIYNAFAVSVNEKMHYLGILGSIGATRRQKANVIRMEAFFEGIVGILLGTAAGVVVMRFIRGTPFAVRFQDLLFIAGSGTVMIGLSCMLPANRAAGASVMDLIIRTYPEKMPGQKVTSLLKKHRFLKTEGAIALKNVLVNETQYTICAALLSLSCCMLAESCYRLEWQRAFSEITGKIVPEASVRSLFQSGVALILTAFALTSIVQKVAADFQLRRKEYAVYQSLGMTKIHLKRMIAMESSAYGIAAAMLGIPFSAFIFWQLRRDGLRWGVYADVSSIEGIQKYEVLKINVHFPYRLLVAEFLLVLAAVILPVIYGFFKLRKLSTEDIRAE